MDNPIELERGKTDEVYKPEPRDLMVVITEYVRNHGKHQVIPQGDYEIEFWTMQIEDSIVGDSELTYRIEDEYTDILIQTFRFDLTPMENLNLEDNTAKGLSFRKGGIQDLESLYNKIKPLVEAEGGKF